MKLFSIIIFLSSLLFCFSCSRLGDTESYQDAVRAAKNYALASGMSLSEYEVHSIEAYGDGKNGRIDLNRTDDYAVKFFDKLRRKNYWEICYRTVEKMLGGEQCYYVEKNSNKILTVYLAQ